MSVSVDDLRAVTLGDIAALIGPPAPPTKPPDRYVDLRETGVYRHALEAVSKGDLPAFRLPGSRKLWVVRADFEAWIERGEHRVAQAPAPAAERPDEIGELIEMNNRSRRGGRAKAR